MIIVLSTPFLTFQKTCEDGYQLTMEVKVTWTKDDGTVEQESKQLVLKRKCHDRR